VFKRFLADASLAGIGSASGGVVAGAVALVVQQWRPQGAR
jgi:predicted benzoate:H+ symporter BenE